MLPAPTKTRALVCRISANISQVLASWMEDREDRGNRLTVEDVRSGIILAGALAVLPVLPDRALDPLGLVNAYTLWRLAVVLMGMHVFSHYAMRILGARSGLLISGFAGGFISSTAVIASMGARVKNDNRLVGACSAASVIATLGSVIFLAMLVTAADPGILAPLTASFACAAAFLIMYAVMLAWRDHSATSATIGPVGSFGLRSGAIFISLVLGFSLLSWALIAWLGPTFIFASVIGTALIDAHAAAVSIANLVASGKLDATSGSFAILVGFSANMLAKAPTSYALGGRAYGTRVSAGLLILVSGLWCGYIWHD